MGDWATQSILYPFCTRHGHSGSVAQRGRRVDAWGPTGGLGRWIRLPCDVHSFSAPARAALPLALDPAGIRRPACHFYNTINLGSIGSDRLPPPRLACFSTPRLPPGAPSLLAFSPSTSPSSRRPRCPPGTEPVSPPLTLSLSSKQVVLSRRSSARLQLRPDPAPFPPFAGAVPPCVLCLLAALVSAGQGGGCRCSGWSVPSFPSSRGCEGRSARGSLRASFFLLADC